MEINFASPTEKPKSKMRCPICDASNWTNLDEHRDKQYWIDQDKIDLDEDINFQICECGFVTYEPRKTEAELKKYYEKDYRCAVNGSNIVTCNRKNEYHKAFLDEEFKKWAKEGKVFCDYGCAQGSVLNMLKTEYGFKTENMLGTEWTVGYRDWGKVMYGVNIKDEIDEKRKYDIIMLYRVLEHLQEPDKKLQKIIKLLKPGGLVYISIPLWFDELQDPPGSLTANFENLFHVDHINVFSKQSAQNLLNKVGLEIIKSDELLYGWTFLCKVGQKKPMKPEKPNEIIDIIKKQKMAIRFLVEGKTYEAADLYPKYPDAIVGKSSTRETFRNFDLQVDVIKRGLELLPDNHKLLFRYAEIYMQWDQTKRGDAGKQKYTNHIKLAEKYLHQSLKSKPGNEEISYYIGLIEYHYKDNLKEALKRWEKALEINPNKFMEFTTFMGHAIAKLPLPAGDTEERPDLPPPTKMKMTTDPKMRVMKKAMGVRK